MNAETVKREVRIVIFTLAAVLVALAVYGLNGAYRLHGRSVDLARRDIEKVIEEIGQERYKEYAAHESAEEWIKDREDEAPALIGPERG